MAIWSDRMPFVLQLLFHCSAIILLLAATARYWRYYREWRGNLVDNSRARTRLPMAIQLENSLFMVAAMICLAVANPDWRFRILFASVALLGTGLTIHRLHSQSKYPPSFDESSILRVGSAGSRSPV